MGTDEEVLIEVICTKSNSVSIFVVILDILLENSVHNCRKLRASRQNIMQVTFQLSVGCLVTHTYCILIEYGRDLEKDIVSETSGHFKQLLVSLLQVSHAKQDTLFAVDFEIRISKTIECLITCSQDKQSLT